ncbi:MAG: 2-hydroxyacid dehydrogenase [Azospirillaceae bacterium]|nr:2-hydroxyacid dehydrogenase [Azospirillaceae bacterium]
MKPDIAIVADLPAVTGAALDAEFTVHRVSRADTTAAALSPIADRIRAIVTSGFRGMTAALMDALPKTEIIASFGVGYDSIDIAAAQARGIRVTNTPDVLTDDVADLALSLLLDAARGITAADRYVRAGRWPTGPYPLGRSVTGKTLGILGLGRIGKAIAARAQACGMKIAYHNRHPRSDVDYPYYPDAVALATVTDFLVLAAPGGAATRHVVDAAVLRALGRDGMLINIARGSLVDETALIAALQNGDIAGAALDVYAREPEVPAALIAMDHVVLLPHVGSATVETRQAMGQLVVDNLRAHFSGAPLLTPVV